MKLAGLKRYSLVVLVATTAAAHAAPLDITDAWFRALPGKLPAAGYFTADNTTPHEIDIVGVSSDLCGRLMLHRSFNHGGMSGMDMVDKVAVAAGGTVHFAPGGYHLMCENPKLKPGTRAPVLFHLSDGSAVAVAFAVRNASGK